MKFLVVLSFVLAATYGAPQLPFHYGFGYHGLGLGALPYGYGLAGPTIVAAAEEEAPAAEEVAAAPALAYAGLPLAGLPYAGLPYAGLPYTAAALPKLELPATAISYTLGGVPFVVPAVATKEEAAEEAVEVAEE